MYLSRLQLRSTRRDVLRDIASPDDMHKTLWRAFPGCEQGGPGRVLFRVDLPDDKAASLTAGPTVIVQSQNCPDWDALPSSYVCEVDFKPIDYDTLFGDGDILRFRLLANPTKKVDGKRVGLLREEEQTAWLQRKGIDHGFEIAASSLVLVPLGTLRSGPASRDKIRSWHAVRYTGLLRVTDRDQFASALANGVGPAKAFGFGLLSVARVF